MNKKTNKKKLYIFISIIILCVILLILLLVNKIKKLNVTNNQSYCPVETETSENKDKVSKNKSIVVYFTKPDNISDPESYYKSFNEDINAMTSASILKSSTGKITGNIGLMAEWIADELGIDSYGIKVKKQYPEDKKENQKIILDEQLYGISPEVIESEINFDNYDVIYLGYPNWYGEPPRALYTFIEENKFDGKTIVSFCSCDRNGFSDSIDILKSKLPDSFVLSEEESLLLNRKEVPDSEEVVRKWANNTDEIVSISENKKNVSSKEQQLLAETLVGQTLTSEQIVEKLGEFKKFSKGTNG